MSRFHRIVLAAALLVPLGAGGAVAADKTLYERLGGYDAIAALTDDFLDRLTTDEKFKVFFVGFSTDSIHRLRQDVVDLFCQQTGGPCFYTGRDMKTAHAGIGITKEMWDASVLAFVASMNTLNVPEQEQKELAALVLPLEKDIVDKP